MSNLGIYQDVREIADLALHHGGGEYYCETLNEARNFSHRFYRFRKAFNRTHHPDGSQSVYDKLYIPRITDNVVRLLIRKPKGTFRPLTETPPSSSEEADELFNIAAELAKKLKGEGND